MTTKSLLLALLAAACSSTTEIPAEQPLVDGVVSQIQSARVLIEADVSKCERFWLLVDSETTILEESTSRKITLSDISVGSRAAAWTNDPVAESCPAQGHADVILLRR